jgi:hypothetical protein
MKKKSFILPVTIVLVVIVASGLSYTTAYIQGLQKAIDMDVRARSNVLLIESLSLSRRSDVEGLINGVELNCSIWASFIRANEPYCSSDTRKMIKEALAAWEKADTKLQELKLSYLEERETGRESE